MKNLLACLALCATSINVNAVETNSICTNEDELTLKIARVFTTLHNKKIDPEQTEIRSTTLLMGESMVTAAWAAINDMIAENCSVSSKELSQIYSDYFSFGYYTYVTYEDGREQRVHAYPTSRAAAQIYQDYLL